MPAGPSGTNVMSSKDRDSKPHTGLGDFQSRLNRETRDRRDNGYDRDRRDDRDRKSWNDAPTPKSVKREGEWDGGSMRVPNRGWDETPRGSGGYGKSGGAGKGRGWDETPRSVRVKKEFPDLEDGEEMAMNGQEWEDEQLRLDRDWYSHDDEGAVVSPFIWHQRVSAHHRVGARRRAQPLFTMAESRAGEGGRDATKSYQAPDGTAGSIRKSNTRSAIRRS